MQLKNPFSTKTRSLFNEACCWVCGWKIRNGESAWTLHHIRGRISNSPLNACPIHNWKCHIDNGILGKRETQISLINRTGAYLVRKMKYVFTPKDIAFLESTIKELHINEPFDWYQPGAVVETTKKTNTSPRRRTVPNLRRNGISSGRPYKAPRNVSGAYKKS